MESYKKEATQSRKTLERRQNEIDQNLRDMEGTSIQNELYITSLENKVNDLEQYTRKNSIRIHGLKGILYPPGREIITCMRWSVGGA